jgi:hypothetical protein
MQAGPSARQQLVLAEQLARPFRDRDENLQGAAAELDGLFALEQKTTRRQ